jgi:hypothetical protein
MTASGDDGSSLTSATKTNNCSQFQSVFFCNILDFKGTIPVHIYLLVGRATGEGIEADKTTVERATGVKIAYIDWAIVLDGRFENGDWVITIWLSA